MAILYACKSCGVPHLAPTQFTRSDQFLSPLSECYFAGARYRCPRA